MTSLTTLFVVGVEEYVEFNESMGSKAFVEHIWDQSKTPLKLEDTSASGSQLHSAGARISSDPPPRIEFPTIVRQRGRGNKYKATGRYISWEELKRRNPVALKDPPSLEEFIRKGSQVGTAERLAPGAFLKGEKKFKITKKPKDMIDLHQSQDGWIGGSSESSYASEVGANGTSSQPPAKGSSSSASMYAPKASSNGSSGSIYAPKPSVGSSASIYATEAPNEPTGANQEVNTSLQNPPEVPAHVSDGQETAPRTLRKSRSGLSLSARLGIDASAKEPEKQPEVPAVPQKPQSTRRPSKLTLPDNRMSILPDQSQTASSATDLKTPVAQTPLSASHPVPETPLKHHGNRQQIDIPPTPNTEQRVSENEMRNLPKAGLMLDPGQSIQATRKSTPLRAARSQMDDMLARLRQARSGLSGGGSGQSMWAPKTAAEDPPVASTSEDKSGSSRQATPTLASVSADVANGDAELTPKLGPSKPEKAKEGAKPKANKSGSAPQAKELTNGKSLLDRLGPKMEETDASNKKGLPLPDTSDKKPVTQSEEKKISSSFADNKVEKKEVDPKPLPLDDPVRSAPTEPKAERIKKEAARDITPTPTLPASEPGTISQKEAAVPQAEPEVIDDTASQVGNDTMTSINWADDDDDDSLPELTEEWMKTALLSPPSSTKKPVKVDSSSVTSDDIQSRHEIDQSPSHPQRGERKGRGSKREKGALPPRGPKSAPLDLGIRIAGSAGKQRSSSASNEDQDLSSVPPWQRRSKAASSPPSNGPLGLRIAGQAETKAKEASKPANVTLDFKSKRNHHAQDQGGDRRPPKQAPVQNRRWGNGSVLPPNATPLQMPDNPFVVDANADSTNKKTRSKGRGGRADHRV
ncbi:uncharacterized protein FA14DRAFT_172328 [Meira miltonrushii]|uniref:Uncharacterized protein n=1 Tax=Meira miltonrushii TaxID=1280837 RepID=A0A316VDF4_9BASI|nr:uncharacterized protein FA14DRAFT_172328 [Meira miltonrushii]PWN35717.1 hypothetical protein FA14DRAFT_172328 [Meira miltonrushii]